MDKEHLLGVSIVILAIALALVVYVREIKSTFIVNGDMYEQVGLMEIEQNGDVLYTPVFKKRTPK